MCICVCGLQNAKYVWEKSEFDSVNPSHTDFLMGKKSMVLFCEAIVFNLFNHTIIQLTSY